MPSLTQRPAFVALGQHHQKIRDQHLRQMFADQSDRFTRLSRHFDDILFDFSKHRVDDETLRLLCTLADEVDLRGAIERMFAGDKINSTEDRAVLHVALRNRSNRPIVVDGQDDGTGGPVVPVCARAADHGVSMTSST